MTLVMVFIATVCVVLVLLLFRQLYGQLKWDDDTVIYWTGERIQFTIRQLMLLTFAVAVLLSLGKWICSYFFIDEFFPAQLWAVITISLCAASTGLVSIWAVMGRGNLLFRCIPAWVFAVALGYVQALVIGGEESHWITWTFANSAFTITSLCVVRQCGFRLVRIVRVQRDLQLVETQTK